jgi:hypothetical protein
MCPLKFEAAREWRTSHGFLLVQQHEEKIMKRTLIAFAAIALLSVSTAWAAPNIVVTDLPAVSVTAYTLERQDIALQATILQVDPVKNTITLQGPQGREETVQVGADARKLDQLKPGAQVDTHYVRAVTLQVLPANSDQPGVEYSGSTTAMHDADDSVIQSHYTETVTTTLSAIDMANDKVTLTGADGYARVVDVRELDKHADFAKYKVGDLVRVTYVEELAISLEPKRVS